MVALNLLHANKQTNMKIFIVTGRYECMTNTYSYYPCFINIDIISKILLNWHWRVGFLGPDYLILQIVLVLEESSSFDSLGLNTCKLYFGSGSFQIFFLCLQTYWILDWSSSSVIFLIAEDPPIFKKINLVAHIHKQWYKHK